MRDGEIRVWYESGTNSGQKFWGKRLKLARGIGQESGRLALENGLCVESILKK